MWSAWPVKVSLILIILFISSCSTSQGPSRWDYMSPENVQCVPKKQVEVCEKIGTRMLCECYLA